MAQKATITYYLQTTCTGAGGRTGRRVHRTKTGLRGRAALLTPLLKRIKFAAAPSLSKSPNPNNQLRRSM